MEMGDMKTLLTLGMAFLFSFSTVTARAEITQWDYSVEGVFTSWTDNKGRTGTGENNSSAIKTVGKKIDLPYQYQGGVEDPGTASGYATLKWGDYSGYSSLRMEKRTGVVTNGENAEGVKLTHINNPITGSASSLAKGVAQIVLQLNPLGIPANLPIYSTTLSFAFFETSNSGNNTDDLFVLLGNPVQPEKFMYEGQEYEFSFSNSFQPIDDWYANYARQALRLDSTVPVFGWTTKENMQTDIRTWFTVNAVSNVPMPTPTPEPATVVLLGIGLVGLGIFSRRRGAQGTPVA